MGDGHPMLRRDFCNLNSSGMTIPFLMELSNFKQVLEIDLWICKEPCSDLTSTPPIFPPGSTQRTFVDPPLPFFA